MQRKNFSPVHLSTKKTHKLMHRPRCLMHTSKEENYILNPLRKWHKGHSNLFVPEKHLSINETF
jgi:hypothetical protein